MVYVGTFFADEEHSRKLGAREGKPRCVFYALCEECFARTDKVEAVEAIIFGPADRGGSS
jgi:hypothetical protein